MVPASVERKFTLQIKDWCKPHMPIPSCDVRRVDIIEMSGVFNHVTLIMLSFDYRQTVQLVWLLVFDFHPTSVLLQWSDEVILFYKLSGGREGTNVCLLSEHVMTHPNVGYKSDNLPVNFSSRTHITMRDWNQEMQSDWYRCYDHYYRTARWYSSYA